MTKRVLKSLAWTACSFVGMYLFCKFVEEDVNWLDRAIEYATYNCVAFFIGYGVGNRDA